MEVATKTSIEGYETLYLENYGLNGVPLYSASGHAATLQGVFKHGTRQKI
jgi:hypothetical protein